jgi:hypothetical protein
VNGTSCTFSLDWQDDYGLDQGILETNASGILHNQTAITLSGTTATFSDSAMLPLLVGQVVAYRFYACDNAGIWNQTQTYYLTTQSAQTVHDWIGLIDIALPAFSILGIGAIALFGAAIVALMKQEAEAAKNLVILGFLFGLVSVVGLIVIIFWMPR